MSKQKDDRQSIKKDIILLISGCVLCVLSMLPFFIMGENSIITYNDQLDGELIPYILNAKHLFQGLDTYPELMKGIPAAGMISPAPVFVFLFKLFTPFVSFMVMMVVTKLSGFVSMYALCRESTKKSLLAFFAGLAFMMLPFYPVYGLCIPGQPFVWLALIIFTRNAPRMRYLLAAYIMIIFYAMTSSLALVGFAVIITYALYSFVLLFKSRVKAFRVFAGMILLILIYTLSNMPLIRQLLGKGSEFVSHKSEITIYGISVIEALKTYLLGKDSYTWCAQGIILVFVVIALILAFILTKEKKNFFKENKSLFNSVLFIVSIIILIVLYSNPLAASIRNSSKGMLHDFSFIRISWLLPSVWMFLLAQSISVLVDKFDSKEKKTVRGIVYTIGLCVITAVFALAGYKSDTKTTVMRMLKGKEYKQISFRQFYSEDLFKEAEDLIGKDKKEYCVISMGLPPASAAYNGFNCLDAYSNNYDLTYKHEFRKIMEKELDKSTYYTAYFDEWGNRCYIYLSAYKTGINAYFYNITFNDIDIDFAKAKDMGADYVISASPITGWENMGLQLMNEEPISSPDCWYVLYVYAIE